MKSKKLAIIGASYLQEPLIQKAKSMGIITYVFAWACDDVGERSADFFFPISIVEKEQILKKCKEIEIDGICSIASDLAAITVNYVAEQMGLVGNSSECVRVSTNKHWMRERFEICGDPSPKSILVNSIEELDGVNFTYPIIIKPVDRSGSRGITKLNSTDGLKEAVEEAKQQGFDKVALVEEFVEGEEYSIECISWNGRHHFLAMTRKYTTGAPHFIETGHIEPGITDKGLLERVKKVVFHALDSLQIQNSASHTELKIAKNGSIRIIEIGGRMGGDCIGSHLVELSTGVDFVKAVIEVALGIEPELEFKYEKAAAVRFILTRNDLEVLSLLKRQHIEYLVEENVNEITDVRVTDSSKRFGYFLMKANSEEELLPYMK